MSLLEVPWNTPCELEVSDITRGLREAHKGSSNLLHLQPVSDLAIHVSPVHSTPSGEVSGFPGAAGGHSSSSSATLHPIRGSFPGGIQESALAIWGKTGRRILSGSRRYASPTRGESPRFVLRSIASPSAARYEQGRPTSGLAESECRYLSISDQPREVARSMAFKLSSVGRCLWIAPDYVASHRNQRSLANAAAQYAFELDQFRFRHNRL